MSDELFQIPAKVLKVGRSARESLLAVAKERGAYDAEIFEERTPFFWSAEISNQNIDSYYTHMLDSTLDNFAADSKRGIGFLNSHRHNELPFGRSLDARVEATSNGRRVLADFYTLPGLNLNGVTTDDFIAGVRSGIVSDVSVGFHGGDWWCDVCGGNYRSYHECQHMAGMRVETKNGIVTCTVGIDGARLSEVSAVYDGATPDATILKAQRMAEAGELDPKTRQHIEMRYRMRLPETRSFAGVDLPETKDNKMDFEKLVGDIRSKLGVEEGGEIDAITALADENKRLVGVEEAHAAAQERINELTPLAEDGRAYREDLINDALAEGVRGYGDKFDKATYETVLRGSTIEIIKRFKADWQALGDGRFSGGRKTVDESEAPKQERKVIGVPESAYRV